MTDPNVPAPNPAKPEPTPRPSRAYRAFIWALRIALAASVSLAILTQSGVLRWLILPRVESALGCLATAGRVSITHRGVLLIRELQLSVPGIDGTAGIFLEAEYVEIVPRWTSLFAGSIPIERINANKPIIRLSQDSELNLNVAALRTRSTGSTPKVIPVVALTDAVLDFGEHGPNWYRPLVSMRVAGSLSRSATGASKYTIEVTEALPASDAPSTDQTPLRVRGELDLANSTGILTIDRVDLDRWQRAAVPTRVADLWAQMAVSGNIKQVALSYAAKEGPIVTFSLDGVRLNVPLPDETEAERLRSSALGPPRAPGALLAMSDVSGDLRFERAGMKANLKGRIEDLPCAVKIETEGYSARAPLVCHIKADRFTVENRPRLLPFAPFYVKRNFQRFSGPTALVDGEVTVRRPRSDSSEPAPLEILGRFDFEQGEAAFEKFPYKFSQMRGTIVFDEKEVRILGITGVGPTGARLLAKGTIAPPTDGGAVIVDVTVADAPYDEHLTQAIPPHRRALLDHLFSESARRELALAIPETQGFRLGGRCDINVAIRRGLGQDAVYQTSVDVRMRDAGMLSSRAPYPIRARALALSITDNALVLHAPSIEGLTGARAALHAAVTLGEGTASDTFDVRVTADTIPCDELLFHALPAGEPEDPPLARPRDFARALGPTGNLAGEGRVFSLEDGAIGYDTHIILDGVHAHIGGNGCLDIAGIRGDLLLTNEDARVLNLAGSIHGASFEAELHADRATNAPQQGTVDVRARFNEIELAEPIEALVTLVDLERARLIHDARARLNPAGKVSGRFNLESTGEDLDLHLETSRLDRLAFDAAGGRIELDEITGALSLDADALHASQFRGALRFNASDAGALHLDGSLGFEHEAYAPLRLEWRDANLASPLVRSLLRSFASRASAFLETFDPRGPFEARAVIEGTAQAPRISGEVEPRGLVLKRDDMEVNFRATSGLIRFSPSGGTLESLRAEADAWNAAVDGSWSTQDHVTIDLLLSLESQGLPMDLAALVPQRTRRTIDEANLDLQGPLSIQGARLRSIAPGTLRLNAVAQGGRASFVVGLPLELESVRADIEADWNVDESKPPTVRSTIEIPAFKAGKLPLTDGRLRIESADDSSVYRVTESSATLHGGTFSVEAVIDPAPAGDATGAAAYSAEFRAVGVQFGPLFDDLRRATNTEKSEPDSGVYRGLVDGTFTLAGKTGTRPERRGRGVLRIDGGEVLSFPGLMPLLRLSNLQAPIGEPLENASASFFLHDNVLTFDRLHASSQSLMIEGQGTMTFPSAELNMRLNTRGRGAIPILDEALLSLRNEIVTTVVEGPLGEPTYRLESFPATKRMLGSIFRGSADPAGRDAARLEPSGPPPPGNAETP